MTFSLQTWVKALRFHFTPCSVLPALLGTLMAFYDTGRFFFKDFVLLMIAITAHHLALNMSDDYFDFLHGADTTTGGCKNAYAGGSGVLVSGEMSLPCMKRGFITLYIITILIGLYFVATHGLVVLVLGGIGVFSSYFYTSPPIRFCYRGFGEVAMLLNFGPIITLGSYYVQSHNISQGSLLMSLPFGFFVLAQILCNEIPDYEGDKKAGKKTLVVRFGSWFGLYAAMGSIGCAFIIMLGGVLTQVVPISSLLLFICTPLIYRSFVLMRQSLPVSPFKGNELMIQANIQAGHLLIGAYAIGAFFQGRERQPIIIIFVTLLLFMTPVFLKFRKCGS